MFFFFHVVNQLSLPPFGEVCPFPTGLSGYHCYVSRLIFLLFHSLGLLVYCCNTTLSYCYFNVSLSIRWSESPILLFKVNLAIVDLLFSLICIGICISAFAKKPRCDFDCKCVAIRGLLRIHTEKAMATHSSTLAWKIPWTEELGRLQSPGSLGVRHH